MQEPAINVEAMIVQRAPPNASDRHSHAAVGISSASSLQEASSS